MPRKDDQSLLSRVNRVLERLDDPTAPKLPAALAADVKAYRLGVTPFVRAADEVAMAVAARDAVLEKVGEADTALDRSLDELANACVGAGLTRRARPFEGLSEYSPSALQALAYKKEVDATGALLDALAKKSPPPKVASEAAKVRKNAAAVQKRLDAVTGPEARLVKARIARDATLDGASKALARFKLRAKGALLDDPGAYEALFGDRAAVQAPAAKPKKKAAKKAGEPKAPEK
jgi:hypothetical protein